MLVGPLARSWFAAVMGLGGGVVGFMTSDVDPKPIDLDAWLTGHGLDGGKGPVIPEPEMASLARAVIADRSIPAASASLQFAASYAWEGGWRDRDMAAVEAIIQDPRATDFPYAEPQIETPTELTQPILDRILKTDMSGKLDAATLRANRAAIERLAAVFFQLPQCAGLPTYPQLRQIATDEARAPYASRMLRRMADAGDAAIPDLAAMVELGLRKGGRRHYGQGLRNGGGRWRPDRFRFGDAARLR